MTCTFELPIGDWSDDGHGKCDYFTIQSNVDYEKTVEIFKKMDAEYHLTSLFEEADQDTLSDFEYERLIAHVPEAAELFDEEYGLVDGTTSAAELFVICMMAYDDWLDLSVISKNVLYQAGFGYGLFYS